MLRPSLLLLATALATNAQTLYEALSKFPELSNFTNLYQSNTAFANLFFSNTTTYPITFLAPSDTAFQSFQSQQGKSLYDVPPESLLEVLQYHTLVSSLSRENFTDGGRAGFTAPTLMESVNNNRSVGAGLAARFGGVERASGQVVFVKNADSGSAKRFVISTRQTGGPKSSIRSGLSSNVNLQTLGDNEGLWEGGRFHIVDGVLTPPDLCATTIRQAKLTNLDNALNRSGLWPALDGSKNITCLGPNDKAFSDAGNPQEKLNETALGNALMFHTLAEVTYSDYLYDGQEFKSMQNGTVRVKVQGEGKDRTIWFNNAKVIDANVLTHNGLMHVLDAVMVPLEQLNSTPSATPSPGASPTSSGGVTQSSTGAAVPLGSTGWNWTWWAVWGAALVMAEGLGGGLLLMSF